MLLAFTIALFLPIVLAEVQRNARVDCIPQSADANINKCQSLGCIWDPHVEEMDLTVPLCYFPKESGYLVNYDYSSESTINLKKSKIGGQTAYGHSFDSLSVNYNKISSSTLKVTITPLEDRYVPPIYLNEKPNEPNFNNPDDELEFDFKEDPVFSFMVRRTGASSSNIWDTSIGGLIFADQYIQIATYLPSDRIYGFGENVHQNLKHDFSTYQTWGMFSRDEAPDSNHVQRKNFYGVHPFYIGIESSGKAHGVFILNSNAQEVTTGPAPHLVYRTIGGRLDIYFFAGPRPEDVVRQYQQLIGRPYLPPYWAFGYQLCRYGFTGVKEINETVTRIQNANIPFDVIYADIDYMDRYKDFTIGQNSNWSNFPAYVDEIHNKNLKLVLIFDPAIEVDYDSFERALDKGASFIEWPRADLVQHEIQDLYPLVNETKIMLGVVWPDQHVAFPDFLDPTGRTQEWWKDELQLFHQQIRFDGVWLDMNEPSNFGTNFHRKLNSFDIPGHPSVDTLNCPLTGPDSKYDSPPYSTVSAAYRNGSLSQSTLCLLGVCGCGKYTLYDTHSIYGWSEIVATSNALDSIFSKRTALFSRSTFPGAGSYSGHWLGDNTATWEDLRTSVIGTQEFNLFGIPFVGADVCGFRSATSEELCLRWQQLGAFYSFFRNHNDLASPPQDPTQWESVTLATRVANIFRYQHLPYLYSLHYRAALFGGTVFRPLFFEFPLDPLTHSIGHQFMWGSSFLVLPVLYPDQDYVHGYLPNATWYSASFAHKYGTRIPSGYSDFNAPHDTALPVFVRGDSIIPRQQAGLTTTETYRNDFQLLVALSAEEPIRTAEGELFWDDGESFNNDVNGGYYYYLFKIHVTEEDARLTITSNSTGHTEKIRVPKLGSFEIFGYQWKPDFDSITVNQKTISSAKSSYSSAKKVAIFKFTEPIDLDNSRYLVIEWNNNGRSGRSAPSDGDETGHSDDDENNSNETNTDSASGSNDFSFSLLIIPFLILFL